MSSNNFSFSSVEDIIATYPDIMKEFLTTYNLKGCYLTSGGYCSYKINTETGCDPDTSDFKKMNCNCDCFLFPLNLEFALNNSIYNLLTDVSSDEFSINTQTIVFTIEEDKGNISNVDLNETQTEQVKMVSIQDVQVQTSVADLSYQTIQDILEQAKTEPSLFTCPISQKFLKMYQDYGSDDLNNIVSDSITSTIQSFTLNNQAITIPLINDEFQKLKLNLSQQDIVKTVVKNIVNVSLGKINKSVLGTQYNKIVKSINSYCYPVNLWAAILIPIAILGIIGLIFYLYHTGRIHF